MATTQEHYETYPYPARNPADEAKRLVGGSPSHPAEVDHFLFGAQRQWQRPIRALFAGGGTGDGLVQFATLLSRAGRPYEITYIDTSRAAREVAEARAAARGLEGITFLTGSLLTAPDHGPFDYIDCCGVLHHLPEPDAGFAALAGALAEDGGLGCMVYALYGRSGVYPIQRAFADLWPDLPAAERLAAAKAALRRVPPDHPLMVNTQVADHKSGDAGLYDLLLHDQDRAYDVPDLMSALERAGLELAGFTAPVLYDLGRIVPDHRLSEASAWATAERLNGTLRKHVFYARRAGAQPAQRLRSMAAVPHLLGVPGAKLAAQLQKGAPVRMSQQGVPFEVDLPREAAPVVAAINGRRSKAQIAAKLGLDPLRFTPLWEEVDSALSAGCGLVYSGYMA